MRSVRLVDDTVLNLHDAGEALSDAILREGDYWERDILDYLAGKYPQHEIILDVGANIGNHTTYFAQYLEYSGIIAYEPVPANFKLLLENVKYLPNIYCRNEAVGMERGKVKMEPNFSNMGASEIREDGSITVTQVRIDDLIISQRVTLIKIDVEWWEPQVLEGAKNIIEEDKPLILIEDAKNTYWNILWGMGYEVDKEWPDHKTYLYRRVDA